SRSQITQLLREAWFTPTGWVDALHVPPVARGWFLRSAVAWERAGSAVAAPFAGVHIVEATKQVYRAIPARRERARLVPALEPALVPSPGLSLACLHSARVEEPPPPSPPPRISGRGPRWRRRRRCKGKRSGWLS